MRTLALLALVSVATAQFGGFFDQMFGGQGHGGQQQRQKNVPSDASSYQRGYESSHCDKYLCPDTLACVHFPHHCPCAWSDHQDKFEMGEGSRICASKGGFKEGEAARKVELARKGML